jgi:hypothetical protein
MSELARRAERDIPILPCCFDITTPTQRARRTEFQKAFPDDDGRYSTLYRELGFVLTDP